jgi:hypothetical protein
MSIFAAFSLSCAISLPSIGAIFLFWRLYHASAPWFCVTWQALPPAAAWALFSKLPWHF